MIRRAGLILFELSLLAGTLAAQVTTTERVSFLPRGTIHVNGSSGDLNVEGWDRPEVEITVIKSMPADYKPKQPDAAKKYLDAVKVSAQVKSSEELVISTDLPARRGLLSPFAPHRTTAGVMLDYEIHVPRDSKLAIHHGTGTVFINSVVGDIEASAGRGDIVLLLPDAGSYTIDAKSKFGTVISDFEGATHLRRYRLGERYATAELPASHKLHLRVGFGGITIKAVPKEAYLVTP